MTKTATTTFSPEENLARSKLSAMIAAADEWLANAVMDVPETDDWQDLPEMPGVCIRPEFKDGGVVGYHVALKEALSRVEH